jgi:ribosomal-protein-alanine N-acetyltransferase
MSPSSIRHAVPDDEPALRRLQRSLDEQAAALLDTALSRALGECLVAVDEGTVVGYLLAVQGDGGLTAPDVAGVGTGRSDDTTVHVAELVVAPEARRNGHASALLATLLSTHPTATVTLTVAPDNHAARALYERFGFEPDRELADFFEDGPALLLARRPRAE